MFRKKKTLPPELVLSPILDAVTNDLALDCRLLGGISLNMKGGLFDGSIATE